MSRGRPPGANLFRMGFEEAAEWISERVERRGTTCYVWVLPDGGIIIRELTETRFNEPPSEALIGTYNREWTLVEVVEGDLIARLRELNQPLVQAAA